jgi:hypothetical protein
VFTASGPPENRIDPACLETGRFCCGFLQVGSRHDRGKGNEALILSRTEQGEIAYPNLPVVIA